MARLPKPGQDVGTWGDVLNDFLSVELNTDGTLKKAGDIAAAASNDSVIHNTSNETVEGVKTFSSSPIVPTPTTSTQATNKAYVDSAISADSPVTSVAGQTGIVTGTQIAADAALTSTYATINTPARAAARGGGLTLLTNTQRLSYTPARDEVVYCTDSTVFYVGDGVTVGGTTTYPTGHTEAQLKRQGWIQPRHQLLQPRLRSTTVGVPGACYGNSIVQGTGSSTTSATWPYQLGVRLQAFTGVDVVNSWAPLNFGVGGSVIYQPLGYSADVLAGTVGIAQVATDAPTSRAYAVLMSLRNETSFAGPLTARLLRQTLRNLQRLYDDVFLVTDPPQHNHTTGVITDGATFEARRKAAQDVCAELGVTFVDFWSKMRWEYDQGVDLRTLSPDGTHPNDDQYRMIADLLFAAMLASPVHSPSPTLREGTTSQENAVALFSGAASSTTGGALTTGALAGLTTASTVRRRKMVEGSNLAYPLTSGQVLIFESPIPVWGVIPVVVQGSTGFANGTWNGVALSSTVDASAGSILERPNAYTYATPTPGRLVLTGASVQTLQVLGVTWQAQDVGDQHDIWPGATEVGAWTSSTLTGVGMGNGAAVRTSTTIGDTLTVSWFGTQLAYGMQAGPDQGAVSVVTDGGAAVPHDLYLSTGTQQLFKATALLGQALHTTVFTIATKNASSSANTVKLGMWRGCVAPSSRMIYIALAAGETMPLTGRWRIASVDRILSGAPYISGWTEKSATLVGAGSGSAVVRLER